MRAKKKKRNKDTNIRYIPLSDMKAINAEYLEEMLNVKQKLNILKDAEIIKEMHAQLLSSYRGAIEMKTLNRKVDYDTEVAKIKARADEQTPVRRGWWWRLIGRWVTNRAQDIIEEQAELEAERIHGETEKELEEERNKLFPGKKKLSRREKRQLKQQQKLEKVIEQSDAVPTNEGLAEPPAAVQEEAPAPPTRKPRNKQQQLGV